MHLTILRILNRLTISSELIDTLKGVFFYFVLMMDFIPVQSFMFDLLAGSTRDLLDSLKSHRVKVRS